MRILSSNTPTMIPGGTATELTPMGITERFADTPGLEGLPGDVARWLEALRRTTDIRTEIVEEVAERIAAGELATRAAVHETAAALYNSRSG